MLTGDKTEVIFLLNSKVLQNNLHLVILADDVEFFVFGGPIFFIISVFVIFSTGRKWETRVALEKVTELLKLLFELLFSMGISYVHK